MNRKLLITYVHVVCMHVHILLLLDVLCGVTFFSVGKTGNQC